MVSELVQSRRLTSRAAGLCNNRVYSYRILYEIKTDRIDILAVIHKRRDLQTAEIPREP